MDKILIDTIGTSFGMQKTIKQKLQIPNKIVSPWTNPYPNKGSDKKGIMEYKLYHPYKKSI